MRKMPRQAGPGDHHRGLFPVLPVVEGEDFFITELAEAAVPAVGEPAGTAIQGRQQAFPAAGLAGVKALGLLAAGHQRDDFREHVGEGRLVIRDEDRGGRLLRRFPAQRLLDHDLDAGDRLGGKAPDGDGRLAGGAEAVATVGGSLAEHGRAGEGHDDAHGPGVGVVSGGIGDAISCQQQIAQVRQAPHQGADRVGVGASRTEGVVHGLRRHDCGDESLRLPVCQQRGQRGVSRSGSDHQVSRLRERGFLYGQSGAQPDRGRRRFEVAYPIAPPRIGGDDACGGGLPQLDGRERIGDVQDHQPRLADGERLAPGLQQPVGRNGGARIGDVPTVNPDDGDAGVADGGRFQCQTVSALRRGLVPAGGEGLHPLTAPVPLALQRLVPVQLQAMIGGGGEACVAPQAHGDGEGAGDGVGEGEGAGDLTGGVDGLPEPGDLRRRLRQIAAVFLPGGLRQTRQGGRRGCLWRPGGQGRSRLSQL